MKFLLLCLFFFTAHLGADVEPPIDVTNRDATTEMLDSKFYAEFFKMLSMLALILVIFFIIAWVFKRIVSQRVQQLNVSSSIQIVEQRYLSPKTTLYVLDIEGKRVIIAESVNGVSPVTEIYGAVQKDESTEELKE